MATKEKTQKNLAEAPKKRFGGRQPGSGRKPGVLGVKARTALEIKNRIAQKADHLLNAELIEALGAFVVMKMDKDGLGYSRVTDENEIVKFIQEHKGFNGEMDGRVYILSASPGNAKSRQYLFDRAFGKPAQSVEVKNDERDIQKIADRVHQRLVNDYGYDSKTAREQVKQLYPELISDASN